LPAAQPNVLAAAAPPPLIVLDGHRLTTEELEDVVEKLSGNSDCTYVSRNYEIAYGGERRVLSDRGIREEKAPFVCSELTLSWVESKTDTLLSTIVSGLIIVSALLFFLGVVMNFLPWYTAAFCLVLGIVPYVNRFMTADTVHRKVVTYAPHLVTALLLEYDCPRVTISSFRENAWARVRRFGAFPLPDRDALLILNGTLEMAEAVLRCRDFFCRSAACIQAARRIA
jgi:hypothetical protein